MLLRRVTEHIRRQDWFAVGVDFAIVVLGVIVGLQVDAWNGEKQDRIAEQEYLHRLYADVDRLLAMQRDSLAPRVRRLDLLGDSADRLFRDVPGDAWTDDHCQALATSHIYPQLPTAVPVLNEMMSTGAVGLIRDVRLRDALSELQIQVSRSKELLTRLSGSARILPRVYPDAIWEEVGPAETEDQRHTDHSHCDFSRFPSNRELLTDVTDNYSRYRAYVATGLLETHERFRDVHALLREILKIPAILAVDSGQLLKV